MDTSDAMGKQAVVVLPASTVPKDRSIRIKTELTIATVRILPNIVGCYRCHMLGHNAARCSVVTGEMEDSKGGYQNRAEIHDNIVFPTNQRASST